MAVDSSTSSQFVSALLFLGVALPDGLEFIPTGPVSSLTHVNMTVTTLCERDIAVNGPASGAGDGEHTRRVHPDRLRSGEVTIKSDPSNADPFLVAALVADGWVSVSHWPVATT